MRNKPQYHHKDHCCYCERNFIYEYSYLRIPTWEHLIPKSQGGSDHISNLRTCCNQCNTWRSNNSLDAWKAEVQTIIQLGRDFRTYKISDLEKIVINIDRIKEAIKLAIPEMFIPIPNSKLTCRKIKQYK